MAQFTQPAVQSAEGAPVFLHTVDALDVIVSVNEPWLSFAASNGAPELTRENVLGRPLWDFIDDYQTRHLYSVIMDRVRRLQEGVSFGFRCDSPTLRRFMEMDVTPREGAAIEFRCRIIRQESHDPVALLAMGGSDEGEMVRSCSWCRRFAVEDEWVEAEEAVRRLELFSAHPACRVTHTICEDCYRAVKMSMEPLGMIRE